MKVEKHEPNSKDIPKWKEFSSFLQRCGALVDSQIELLGHRAGAT
jgi:hypothetical protein